VLLKSNRVLWPDGELRPGCVAIEGGRILELRVASAPGALDLEDRLLLPGMVDLHGDAFERQWMPRSGVFFPLDVALVDSDRQLLANGITTAYHGLTVSWEPGLRGIEHGRLMVTALDRIRPVLQCDTRLHLRYELYALNETAEILDWIRGGKVHLVGFNDHLEMIAAKLDKGAKGAQYAERSGLTIEAFRALLEATRARQAEVWPAVEAVAQASREGRIPMASHDDESPAMSERFRRIGSSICEFPLDEATAQAEQEAGQEVILGGPNIVRGKSHIRRLGATETLRRGLGTVLTSDYYYPALLHAAFRLVRDGVLPFGAAWALVSSAPARAAGLEDRGRIEAGLRADLIVVDDSQESLPRVSMAVVEGRLAHLADPGIWNG
jgi:alpha-D-ribose 1-methylphosphonate 5-triphosphate diphosphatase